MDTATAGAPAAGRTGPARRTTPGTASIRTTRTAPTARAPDPRRTSAAGSRAAPGSRSGARRRRSMPRMATMKTILVVDDERKIADLARDYLEHAGFAVRIASDGETALTAIRRDRPDLVVLDLGLPG